MHKYVITVANSGKIFALDSKTGEIIWQRQPSAGVFALDSPKLHILRPTGAATPIMALSGKSAGGFVVEPFNPLTGEDLPGAQVYAGGVSVVVPAPCTDSVGTQVLLVLDGAGVQTFPKSADAVAAVVAHGRPIFVHQINKETGLINGYKVGSAKGTVLVF
jgi:hypothetical protein